MNRPIAIALVSLLQVLVTGVSASADAQTLTPSEWMAWARDSLITKQLDPGDTLRFLNVCGTSIDEDQDCLWDVQEYEIANRFAPILFMDEDEDCGIAYGWGPQARFQVRPISTDANYTVHDWQPTDGELKVVRITYYMNWPLDCGHGPGHAGRHLGDSEKFSYLLVTMNLNEFALLTSTHNYHSDSSTRFGWTTRNNADLSGFDRPIIAVGQNKHASWWGRGLSHNDCARHEDSHVDDCFGQDWAFDASSYLHVSGGGLAPNGYHDNVHPLILSQSHNIGEPVEPNTIDPATGFSVGRRFIVVGSGGVIQSELIDPAQPSLGRRYFEFPPAPLDGGREYWFAPPSGYQRFCGFLCRPEDQRHSNGDCDRDNVDIHPGYSESFDDSIYSAACASSLREKLDFTPSYFGFGSPPSLSTGLTASDSCVGRSCTSRNNTNRAACQCDEACHHFGDCCSDKVSVCGDFDANSCANKCGRRWTDRSHTCSCSYDCQARGDCCTDALALCPTEIATPSAHSCSSRCGFKQDDYFTCSCDLLCRTRGDCCMDHLEACPITGNTRLGSCADACGPTAGSAYGGLCFCDSGCIDRGDCCLDAGAVCDVQIKGSNIPMPSGFSAEQVFCAERPAACRAVQNTYIVNASWP